MKMDSTCEQYRDACRVCTVHRSDGHQLITLFHTMAPAPTTTSNPIKLSEMFTACTAIHLYPDDELPHWICTKCMDNLQAAYNFRVQCQQSDMEMREAFNSYRDALTAPDNTDKIDPDTLEPIKVERIDVGLIALQDADDSIKPKIESDTEQDSESEYNPPSNLIDSAASDVDSEDSEYTVPLKKLKTSNLTKFCCHLCGKAFKKSCLLERHMEFHNTIDKPYECEVCKYRFKSKGSLLKHQTKIKHGKYITRKIECSEYDNSKTRHNSQPERDLNTAEEEEENSVPDGQNHSRPDEYTPDEYEIIQQPLHTHLPNDLTDNKQFKCEFCPKKFTRLNYLTRHVKVHNEFKSHKCTMCNETFAVAAQLTEHINMHKGVKPHVCPQCNKGFQKYCLLRDHIRRHNGETPFLCSECGKAFNNRSNLHQHLQRHTGIKPYACTDCPSRFICKAKLNAHMVTHTGIKAFVCDTCGSSFTKNWSLTTHKRIHTGERPYACELCEMRFNSPDHVKRHMRTHTGEKPYKCKYCDRAFAQSNDLVKHTRSHVGDNTYQCKQCPAAFRLFGELRAHGKVHFNDPKQSGDDTLHSPFSKRGDQTAMANVTSDMKNER